MNFLVFNTEKYPFNNVNVRKALSLAISRESATSFNEKQSPALGLIADGENNYIKDGDRVSAQLTFNSA